MTSKQYRLITRSDLDGIVTAVLLRAKGLVDEVLFTHPQDMQDGLIEVGPNDIITCLPAHPHAGMIFTTEEDASGEPSCPPDRLIKILGAGSASEAVYRHLGGTIALPQISPQLLAATRALHQASLSKQDILTPAGWTLLGYLTDSRTGLGRFRRFRISNYQLMLSMIDILSTHGSVDDILAHPDIAERVEMYREHAQPARAQLVRCARVTGPLVTLDMRGEETIYVTNRFTVYALFPQCGLSMHVLPGKQNRNVVFAAGRSILNQAAPCPDIGKIMQAHGGGGHPGAGACQASHAEAEKVKEALVASLSQPVLPS